MVDKFPPPRRDLRKVIFYNENKVKNKTAIYIAAVNFHKEIDEMTPEEKIEFFNLRNSLRPTVKANIPHIVLSFHPSERFSSEKFEEIVKMFMTEIGFGDQPYLIYYHTDTAAPHLHIVTTIIKANGQPIPTHDIGKKLCEPARIKVEERFGLIKAKGRRKANLMESETSQARVRRLKYGTDETYSTIAKTVEAITKNYVFTTMGEFNAILKQFNVFAETGHSGTKTAVNNGLYYRALDDNGKPKGVPIKASQLPGKPTLKYLEGRFQANRRLKEENVKSIRIRVGWVLKQRPKNLAAFEDLLERDQLKIVLWRNDEGLAYGITFFDQRTKTAVNGRELGREMSIAGIQKSLDAGTATVAKVGRQDHPDQLSHHLVISSPGSITSFHRDMLLSELLELWLLPVQAEERIPYEFTAKKKRKKRKPPYS